MKKSDARRLSRFIAVAHVAFIILVLASLPLALAAPDYRLVAITLIAGTFVVWFVFGGECPLTLYENRLRAQTGEKKLAPDFISYHLQRSLRIPAFSTRVVWYSVYAYCAAIIGVSLT